VTGSIFFLVVAIAFVLVQVDIAAKAIQCHLRMIGESVYQSRSEHGKWPTRIEDLEGTELARQIPRWRTFLQGEHYIVVWQQDLDPNPVENAQRILVYDNGSLLSQFGKVWVCRGDLRIEYLDADTLQGLLRAIEH
jgi:hypothetical protein